MKGLIKGAVLAAAAGFALASAVNASAEGSRDLIGYTDGDAFTYYGGTRPFLEWKDSSQMGLPRTSVIYVYAKAGERIYFASSVPYANRASAELIGNGIDLTGVITEVNTCPSIAVTLPAQENGMPYDPGSGAVAKQGEVLNTGDFTYSASDNSLYFFGFNTSRELYEDGNATGRYNDAAGYIKNHKEEKAGPNINGSNGGFDPLSFTAPVTGTYAFRFLSVNGESGANWHTNWTTADGSADSNINFSEYYDKDNGYYKDSEGEYIKDEIKYTNTQQVSTVAAWDVTVTDSEDNIQSGRVWSDIMFLDMGYNASPLLGLSPALYSQMYVLTHDGFEYKVDFNGMDPFGFAFYSNKRGLLFDHYSAYSDEEMHEVYTAPLQMVRPLYHSFYSIDGNDVGAPPMRIDKDTFGNPLTIKLENGALKQLRSRVLQNLTPVDPNRDTTHKIFINQPSGDAVEAYNGKAVVTSRDDIEKPKNIRVTYTGSGSAAAIKNNVPYGTKGVGGEFTLNIPKDSFTNESGEPKSFRITLNFSKYKLDALNAPVENGGAWAEGTGTDSEKNNIVVLSNVIVDDNGNPIGTDDGTSYVYTFAWDGKDAYGNDVPVGVYDNQIVSSSWEVGAAHFPMLDVENNTNGIKIERINLPDENADLVYYNNEAVSPSENEDSASAWYFTGMTDSSKYPSTIGDGLNMTAGVHSADGAMSYTLLGDRCALDIWTYYTLTTDEEISIGVAEPEKIVENVQAYVSFVAEDGTTNADDLKASHFGYYNGNNFDYIYSNDDTKIAQQITDNSGHKQLFGNTIATCLFTSMTGLTGESYYVNCTINIPTGGAHASYVKLRNGESAPGTGIILEDEPVLTDSEGVGYNRGSIFKIKGFDKEGDTKTITMSGDTYISGEGTIVCALIFDNLYAPDASVTTSFSGSLPDGAISIENKGIEALSASEYSEAFRTGIGYTTTEVD